MKTIWKYKLTPELGSSVVELFLPLGALPLHVGNQSDVLTMWAMVDPNEEAVCKRRFEIVGTGNRVPEGPHNYIGTIQCPSDHGFEFVFHIFELTEQ